MKVMSIFGTRPEMIKMWATLKKLDELNFDHVMVHTGQNFTPELRDFFFKDLKLRKPDFELDIDTSGYGPEVADVILKSDALMEKVKPDALLILGDTYSGLSVLPAAHRGIKIFHMEAGLRAWDRRMPEQRNRILIDHISNILLPYNRYHRENLLREGIHPSKIIVTGQYDVRGDARLRSRDRSQRHSRAGSGSEPKNYILVTAHRSENVDNPENLANIFKALGELNRRLKREIIFPMHPRTTSKLKAITVPPNIRIMAPLGFYDFNQLLKQSFCVLVRLGHGRRGGAVLQGPECELAHGDRTDGDAGERGDHRVRNGRRRTSWKR